jgi:hypothetical protein
MGLEKLWPQTHVDEVAISQTDGFCCVLPPQDRVLQLRGDVSMILGDADGDGEGSLNGAILRL